MSFVYWGAINSGSDHLNRMFEFNEVSHTHHFGAVYKFRKYLYPKPKTHQEWDYYKPKNKNKLEKHLINERRSFNPFTEETYKYSEKHNFVDNRTHDNFVIHESGDKRGMERTLHQHNKGDTIINYDEYEPFLKYAPSEWENYALDDMIDVEMLVRPLHLIGMVKYERVHPTTNKIVSILKKTTNIVPYKEDIIDSLISKLNMFEPPKHSRRYTKRTGKPVLFKTIIDAYNRDKDIVWSHLDEFLKQQRDIEEILQEYKIPYDYLNLDTDDYSRFKLKTILPRKYSHPNFDLDNVEINHRHDILKDLAEEYVTVRKLTDMRLSGRITDRI